MAKFTPSKKDIMEYKKLAKSVKAKQARIKKKYNVVEPHVTPPKLENIQSRKQYNLWKEEAKDFTNRYNTRYQYVTNSAGKSFNKEKVRKAEKATKIANYKIRQRQEQMSNLPVYYKGKQISTVGREEARRQYSQISSTREYPEFDINNIQTESRLDDIIAYRTERAKADHFDKRDLQMRDNFIKMLEGQYGSNADKIIEEVKKLNGLQFVELFAMTRDIEMSSYYSKESEDEEINGRLDQFMENVNRFKKNKNMQSFILPDIR